MKFTHLVLFVFPLASMALVSCGGDAPNTTAKHAPRATTPAPIAQVSAEMPPIDRGAKLYKRCKACHTLNQGGKHKVGPNLWAIYGSKAGSKEGFAYSKVMAASTVIWDAETLDAYIQKPSEFMKGNRMSFIGLKKQEDRDAVQVYLRAKTAP